MVCFFFFNMSCYLRSCLAVAVQLQILRHKTTLFGNMQRGSEEARQEALGFGLILNPETTRLLILIMN